MPRDALRVRGYRELMRATARARRSVKKETRKVFREVAEPIRDEAQQRFDAYDRYSAAGYRVSVRQRGVFVVQSLRKTTGLRPDYGALQMRKALLPALYDKRRLLQERTEKAFDRIADTFNSLP